MRHLAALIVALLLALPSAALADPQVYNTADEERTSAHFRPADEADGPAAAYMTDRDDEGRWMNFRGWLVRWLPIILGQDRPLDGA